MNKSTICRYPFNAIAIKQYDKDGNPISAWPCCMMGNNTFNEISKNEYFPNRLNFNKQDLDSLTPEELFNHPNFEKLRQDLKAGIKNPACTICWEQEDRGIKSYRQWANDIKNFDEIISNQKLEVVDFSINNLCNLACRMCTPDSSSLLMKDFNFFKNNNLEDKAIRALERWPKFKTESFKLRKQPQWKWLLERAKSDEKLILRLSGGEPFYNDEVLNFLDECIKNNTAKNITLEFHTNATLFDDNLIDKLKNFKNNLNFSIDGAGKVYEYIRYPATWEQLNSSVSLYINNIHQNFYNVNYIIMITNLFNIPEYVEWIEYFNKDVTTHFAEVHFLTRGTSIRNLSIPLLEEAKQEIIEISKYTRYNYNNAINLIEDSIKNNTENKQKCLDELELFDLSRNQSYKDYLDSRIVNWLSTC